MVRCACADPAVPLQPWFSFADFSLREHLHMRIIFLFVLLVMENYPLKGGALSNFRSQDSAGRILFQLLAFPLGVTLSNKSPFR